MQSGKRCISAALLFGFALPLSLPAANRKAASDLPSSLPTHSRPPQRETLDYDMYQRIRLEGINHSHVMQYASALDDDIGPRLTGSQNLRTHQRVDARPIHRHGLR